MSRHDSDGIDEALQGATHVAVTVAARAGEELARELERRMRKAEAENLQAHREDHTRLSAERSAVRAHLSDVHRPEWWESATVDDVRSVVTTAGAWKDIDEEARKAHERIATEVQSRYNMSLSNGSKHEAVDASGQAEETQRGATRDIVEADWLMQRVDAVEQRAEAQGTIEGSGAKDNTRDEFFPDGEDLRLQAEARYDSAERREKTREQLVSLVGEKTADACYRADLAQAKPAFEAIRVVGEARQGRAGRATGLGRPRVQSPGIDR